MTRRHLWVLLVVVLLRLPGTSSSGNGLPARTQPGNPPEKSHTVPVNSISIEKVETGEVSLPPEFQMALYEDLIEQVQKTGRFLMVYRSGDRRVDQAADLVTLRTSVESFKKGSERAREVTTVAGATSLKVHVEITARDGRKLMDRDVVGRVRFFGDNLRATYNFAKNVATLIRENM